MPATTSRPNATKVCAIYEAGSISVCRAGDLVALHIHTTSGEVIVRMAERQFVVDCRGPRDANGNTLRTFEQLDEQSRHNAEKLIADKQAEHAAALGISDEMAAKCQQAWQVYVNDPMASQRTAAEKCGLVYVTFNTWVRHHHAIEAAQIRSERQGSYVTRGRKK